MCSPYLTGNIDQSEYSFILILAGSLAIMLVIVTFNYWTVSTENSDLAKKIHEMTGQLKSGSIHINSLEEELKHCKGDKRQLKSEQESRYQELESKHGKLEQKLKVMDDLKQEKELEEAKFSEDAERQMKMVDSLRDDLESVKQSLETVKLNLTSCSSELAAERACWERWVKQQGIGTQTDLTPPAKETTVNLHESSRLTELYDGDKQLPS